MGALALWDTISPISKMKYLREPTESSLTRPVPLLKQRIFRLRFNRKHVRAIRRALESRRRLSAKVHVVTQAERGAGSATARRTIKLRR
jgi:hypothetical protein